ncbi:MAG: hypothetical protein PHI40_08255 [Caldisericia bacterium]|nr:hypothetical protein [Caldisericia bacterium]
MKKKNLILILCVICLVGGFVFFAKYYPSPVVKNSPSLSLKNSFFYRMYPWDTHRIMVDHFYDYQELTEQTQLSMFKEKTNKDPSENTTDLSPSQNNTQDGTTNPTVGLPWAQVFASLTGSVGSLGVSGKAKNATFVIQGVPQGTTFQQGAGSSFSVDIHSSTGNKKVSVRSPSFATNKALQSLTIGIDPFSMYMTLNGRLHLDLPGDIMGTMYNASNGSSSSTTLHNGYFSVSVPLTDGVNNITASGKWMTIELQFPGISVTIG